MSGVGIIGGGLIGLTTAYRLAQAGVPVTVYERDGKLGGLAATTDLGGYAVDRYYHVVLPTDHRVRDLAAEVGIGEDRFRFATTRVGFYQQGQLTSMSSPRELLTFPGLSMVDRVRLGAFAARCQMKPGFDDLEDLTLEAWLRKVCGNRLWESLWRPLLDSKFDGRYDDLPATYLWARTRRMSATRDKAAREVMGTIDGGYQVLVDALAREISKLGGEILTRTAVQSVPSAGGRALGVVVDGQLRQHEMVVTTQLRPGLDGLLAPELDAALGEDPNRYLGVVCLVARVKKSISPYYALNITDRSIPLTTIVETTHVVDPERVGGTLLYIPKYVNPDSPDLDRPADEIEREYFAHARTMFPALTEDDVIASEVARARVAEPIHTVGRKRLGDADLFPAPGLATASSAHVYPELVNGQAVLSVAERLVAGLLERVDTQQSEDRAA